jgi:putative sterol carrier protein
MLDLKRNVDPGHMPKDQAVIHLRYPELTNTRRRWWLIVEGGDVEITQEDPGVDPDLTVEGPLSAMTEIWMGLSTVRQQVAAGNLKLTGDRRVADSMQSWLGLSPFASEPKRAA